MRARTLVIASFAAVALSTAALVTLAQTTKPAPSGTTSNTSDRRDTDKDGVISAKEKSAARDKAQARFNEADKNRDGALSREEARAGGYRNIEKNFDAMDTNKDGKVTREERRAWTKANRSAKASSKSSQTSSKSSQTSSKSGQTSSEGGLLPPR